MAEAVYTLEEVAVNDGHSVGARTWIVIKDSVYDVTDYLSKHPGGEHLILEYAGRDATAGFNDFGHSTDAKTILKTYKIGKLIEEDQLVNRWKKKNQKNNMMNTSSVKANERIKQRCRKLLFPIFARCAS